MKCNLCHKDFNNTREDRREIRKHVKNLVICNECFEYYLTNRIIHPFVCKTCGCEFMINRKMSYCRDMTSLTINECKDCARKSGRIKQEKTMLDKYGVRNAMQSEEIRIRATNTMLDKYGVRNAMQSEEIKNKAETSMIDKYGVRKPMQYEAFRNKRNVTTALRYGVKHTSQSPIVKHKNIHTCLLRYGVKYTGQVKEFIDKKEHTYLQKYGVTNPAKNDDVKEKTKQTCLLRYGVAVPAKNDDVKEKIKQTCLLRYGVTTPAKNDDVKEKFKQTCLERFGVDNPRKSEHVKKHIRNTMINKYGVPFSLQSPEIRSKQAKSARVSKLEKRVIEMLTNRKLEFQHQYVIRQNGITHAFDFAIFRHGKLVALVDTDGLYYHGYLDDSNQTQEYDSKRTLCIPEGVRFIVIFENKLEDGFKELLSALNVDYDSYLKRIFKWCRAMGFPDYKYSNKDLWKSYKSLRSCDTFRKLSKIGERIIRHFHPSILRSRRAGCISPYDGYMDDELLMKVIKNRFIYANSMEPPRILEGFNISKIAPKVSVFSPSLAKTLVQKYLSSFSTVFDPFSGFSGRMLGTCSLGKKYIGQDINGDIVRESNQIIEFFGLEAEVSQKDILESSGEYPCLFTCSPYSNKEIWGTETEFRSCDEWIDECLARFKCSAYLFVVDETKKYSQFVVEELTNKSHFGKNTEKIIFIKR